MAKTWCGFRAHNQAVRAKWNKLIERQGDGVEVVDLEAPPERRSDREANPPKARVERATSHKH